jgi:hypothetical protein
MNWKALAFEVALVAIGAAIASVAVRLWITDAPASAATVGLVKRVPTGGSAS